MLIHIITTNKHLLLTKGRAYPTGDSASFTDTQATCVEE